MGWVWVGDACQCMRVDDAEGGALGLAKPPTWARRRQAGTGAAAFTAAVRCVCLAADCRAVDDARSIWGACNATAIMICASRRFATA